MGPARRGWRLVPQAVLVLVLAHAALAEDYEPKVSKDLQGQTEFHLFVQDDSRDDCWPRPTETKSVVEYHLKQKGLELGDTSWGKRLVLHVQAFAVNAGTECVHVVKFGMPESDWEGSQILMHGPKHVGQGRVTKSLLDLANRFLADWAYSNQ